MHRAADSLRTLTIERLNRDWMGVCVRDGVEHIVPDTLPGDVVLARLVARSQHHPRLFYERVSLLEPSPHRTATCPHRPECSGCPGIEWDYARQIEWKRERVMGAMEKVAPRPALDSFTFHPSPRTLGYRTKAKWNVGFARDGSVAVGVYMRRSHVVVRTPRCAVNHPDLVALYPLLEEMARALTSYDETSHQGLVRAFIAKRVTSGDIQLAVVTSRPPTEEEKATIRTIASGSIDSLVVNINPMVTNRLTGTQTHTVYGPDFLWEEDHPIPYPVTAVAFSQVNQDIARRIYDLIGAWAREHCPSGCLDLYAGVGPVALVLKHAGIRTAGVEKEPENVRLARMHGQIEIHLASAEDPDIKEIASSFEGVVVDPPRSGLRPQVIDNIDGAGIRTIIYMSCSVDSLARDAELLAQRGFSLQKLMAFDMFPHTPHVESLALFSR